MQKILRMNAVLLAGAFVGALLYLTPAKADDLANKPYHALIEKYAKQHNIPVRMAHAFIKVESNYNHRTRGRVGEIGLMQLRPQTARGIGYKGTMSALYTPETNIRWGMKYLAMAYKKAGGDLCRTVMGYQSGLYAKRFSKANAVYCSKAKKYLASL